MQLPKIGQKLRFTQHIKLQGLYDIGLLAYSTLNCGFCVFLYLYAILYFFMVGLRCLRSLLQGAFP